MKESGQICSDSFAFLVKSCYSMACQKNVFFGFEYLGGSFKMTVKFDEKMRLLHQEFGDISPEEKKELKQKLKKSNILAFRKIVKMKHDLLRLEAKRASFCCSAVSGNELEELEDKIIQKKREFLTILLKAKETKK